jgi:ribonuclease HI
MDMGIWNPEWYLYVDAAIDEGHARVGVALVLRNAVGQVWRWEKAVIQGPMTSNEAEYAALVWALMRVERIRKLWRPRLIVHLDNAIVVSQLHGTAAVRHPALRHWYLQARAWAQRFPGISFVHIPRHQNMLAHALARLALQEEPDVRRH